MHAVVFIGGVNGGVQLVGLNEDTEALVSRMPFLCEVSLMF